MLRVSICFVPVSVFGILVLYFGGGAAVRSASVPEIVTLLFLMSLCLVPLVPWHRARRSCQVLPRVAGDALYHDAMLDLLFHVARTDGVVSKDGIDTIRHVFLEATGTYATKEMMSAHFARFTSNASVLGKVATYRGAQAEVLLDAAILVAVRNGEIPRGKRAFLTRLNMRLGAGEARFEKSLSAALGADFKIPTAAQPAPTS